MSFAEIYSGTEIIDIGNGYWIRIKESLTRDEKRRADAHLQKVEGMMDDSGKVRGVVNPDYASYQHVMVAASIVAWNLDEIDGSLWPLSPWDARDRSVGCLPDVVFEKVFDRVVDLNKRDPAEDRTFHDSATGRNSHGNGRTADASEVPDGVEAVAEVGNPG